jgi:VWFA-related protein
MLLSDGVDYLGRTSIETAIEYAQRADTVIYSIVYATHVPTLGRKVMQRLAQETGGRCFIVSPNDSIEKIYAQIEEELRSQYSLGYSPDRTDASIKYRKIHLATRRRDLTVRTRDGYYAE